MTGTILRGSRGAGLGVALLLGLLPLAGCGGSGGSGVTAPTSALPVASVDVSPGTASVGVGATLQLAATCRDTSGVTLYGRTVSWSTDRQAVATVDANGLVTGMAAGGASITATCEGQHASATITVTQVTGGGQRRFSHVVIVLEENMGYASVIGSSSAPYMNSLATQYGLATSYYADSHPSLPNYFWLTVGKPIASDDNYSGTVTDDNIVRELVAAGRTWKCYAQGLPSVGYVGGDKGSYTRHHNPFTYLSDVTGSTTQRNSIVPFEGTFAADVAAGTLPDFSFVVPDEAHDAHSGPLSTADNWLQTNIGPYLASPAFTNDGLLIVTFDEAAKSDAVHGGGRVVCVVASPRSRPGYRSATLFQHESTLRLALKALGVTTFPNGAATAPDMDEFFMP